MRVATFLLVAGLTNAFHLPSWIPFVHSQEAQQTLGLPPDDIARNRIAIIGAGAGGSSAAFWISKAKERFGLDVEVDVYDKNDYIGGRSITVQPYDDPELVPKELGGSIFVKSNKNLWRATDEFGLERTDFGDEATATGIWDGSQFIITVGGGKHFYDSWFDSLKVVWRYGYRAPMKTKSIVDKMVKKFVEFYDPSAQTFPNITELTTRLGWSEFLAQTTSEYLDLQGIDHRWTREMIEAATRVNYGQNVDALHALEGLVSMAATGAAAVKTGNFRIFEEFLHRSKANVYLNTTVKGIKRDEKTSLWALQTLNASTVMEDTRYYRGVILAAPVHQTSIDLKLPKDVPVIPAQPYVHLHVTLLTTTSPHAKPSYFGLADDAVIPPWVLTTYEGARFGGVEPEFNSLSVHGKLQRKDGKEREKDEYVVKIFSKQRISDEFLNKLFDGVGWVYRKEWDAYPVLPPTTTFPPVKIDTGFYYVNAFEPFISTMETETISSRNVVDLLLEELFDSGICKKATNATEVPERRGEEFVYGWDC
ncbi:prenylcysteine oxidase family protein [Abortiporus biennis]